MMNVGHFLPLTFMLVVFPAIHGCAYFDGWMNQVSYRLNQKIDPSQRNLKHLIDKQTFIVYGRVLGDRKRYKGQDISVAAYGDAFGKKELVDATYVVNMDTHYGLNLPKGEFDLLVFADQDNNQKFDKAEIVGRAKLDLDADTQSDHIAADVDIQLGKPQTVEWLTEVPSPRSLRLQASLFYPEGTIRQLNDPLFDSQNALLGLYDPAAFLELAPTMFYALEEDSYKIPVIFVHGISGSARQFAPIVEQLDRQRYQPWFYFYPSGMSLEQLATLFYDLFLSGTVNPRGQMPMIFVAHSMGGLVVREALNQYHGVETENRPALLITLATPFGGHPVAAKGVERAPLVIPSWRDLDPQGAFISRLFRTPLKIDHHLLYAEGRTQANSGGDKTDGVVPIDSQTVDEAMDQSSQQVGFRASHAGILENHEVIQHVIQSMSRIDSSYPEPHLKVLAEGGYDVELDDRYSDMGKHFIRTKGKFLSAVSNGSLDTLGNADLERFVLIVHGKLPATTAAEKDWLQFLDDYPQYKPEILREVRP